MNTSKTRTPWHRRLPGVGWAAIIATLYSLLTLAASAWSSGFPGPVTAEGLVKPAVVALVVLAAFLLLVRWPVAAFCVVAAAIFQLRFLPNLWGYGVEMLLIPAGYHLGRRTRPRTAALLALAATVVGMAASAVQFRHDLLGSSVEGAPPVSENVHYTAAVMLGFLTGHITSVLLPVLGGMIVRKQVAQAELIERRAAEERAAHDAATVAALRADRERMARELHDLAAHHSTAAVINAKAARKLGASDPARVPELMDEVVVETQAAQTSLRQMVRVLHDPDDAVPFQPQPTLAEIPAAVAHARRVNSDVVLEMDLPEDLAVAESTALAAWRIVQESLTNAHRYAPGAPLTVRVERDDDLLVVEVVNGRSSQLVDDAGLGMGQGIAGMRQRAELLGGFLEAGPHGRGWRVLAELPLQPDVDEADPQWHQPVGGAR
ncbi:MULTISPECIES: sensor histidine kinase [unclassified Luteococcus]|uniref:sensor histidine kinase n=1 Tax=unclassified Luteococcus TaxID=2639923 RepID=UPI00313BDDE1